MICKHYIDVFLFYQVINIEYTLFKKLNKIMTLINNYNSIQNKRYIACKTF